MKNQLKIYLKSFILLFGISLLLLNCEKDDAEINIPKSTISIKKITFNEINKNKVIAGELNKFNSINSQNNDLSKSEIYNDEYGFSIETGEAIYIEYDSYHSYTFQVYRNVDSLYTENLLLSLQEDSTYKAYLINYNFTEQERELVANGDYVSLADKTTFTPLHNYNIEEVLNSLSKTAESCYELQEWTSVLTGWTVLREVEVPCGVDQNNEIEAGGSAGGGGSYDNTGIPDDPNTSDTGSGGGEGGTASNSGENTGNENINTENCVQDTNGDCIGNMTAPVISNLAYITNNYLNGSLTSEQLNFLTNNKDFNIEINDFLNSNRDTDNLITQEAKDVALMSIKVIQNNFFLEGPYDSKYFNLINQYTTVDLTDPYLAAIWTSHFSAQCAILKFDNPTWSNTKIYWEASKEMIHLAFDIAGLVPVVGEVFDLANGIIYTIEGDGLNATLSFAATIPVAGWFATGGKFANKAISLANGSKTTLKWIVKSDGLIKFSDRSQLRKIMNITDSSIHAHHLIPYSLDVNELVQKAAKSKRAWHINDIYNGVPMSNNLHLTGHSNYLTRVEEVLTSLNLQVATNNFDEAYDALLGFNNYLQNLIAKNPTFNSGQIANLINYP